MIRNTFNPWFRISDLPAGRVRVRVSWSGRHFVATHDLHPDGFWGWTVYRNGDIVWLPGNDPALSDEPDAWQPEDASRFEWSLPEPMRPVEQRFWSARTSFAAVDDAETADLAREMETDREVSRAQGDRQSGQHNHEQSQWWKSERVVYDRPGEITLRDCEARVMRAMACCGAGLPIAPRQKTTLTLMVALTEQNDADAREAAQRRVLRFQPSSSDVQDFEMAMAWVTLLNPPEIWHKRRELWELNRQQRVLLLRSRDVPPSFADIGFRYSINPSRAREIYVDTIEKCWKLANGVAVRGRGRPKKVVETNILEVA